MKEQIFNFIYDFFSQTTPLVYGTSKYIKQLYNEYYFGIGAYMIDIVILVDKLRCFFLTVKVFFMIMLLRVSFYFYF